MVYSVPDICDDFPEDISVLESLFADFGKKWRFRPGQFLYADANGAVLACNDLELEF